MTTNALTMLEILVPCIFNKQKMSQRFRTVSQQLNPTSGDDGQGNKNDFCEKQVLYRLEIRYRRRLQRCPLSLLILQVLDGKGTLTVDGTTSSNRKTDSFILPSGTPELQINGSVQLIVSQSNQ